MHRLPAKLSSPRAALSALGWASLVGMALAMAGASIGRTDLTSPSGAWAATAIGSLIGALLVWAGAWRIKHLLGHQTCWIGAGLPLLATLDGWIIAAFHYLHEPTNHLLTVGLVTPELFARPSVTEWLSVKFVALTLLWVGWPRLAARGHRRSGLVRGAAATVPGPAAGAVASQGLMVVAAVGALAYLRLALLDVLAIEVPSDLRVNYIGALALREGLNPYDNAVALQVAGREAIPYVGTRLWAMVTNPPTAMLYFAPFSTMPLAAARLVFLAVNHLALLATAALTWRMVRPARTPWVWLGLVLGVAALLDPILLAFRLGQVDLIIGLALAAAAYRLRGGDDAWAGACIGIAAMLKIAPGLLALYLLWRRRWKALGGLAATVIAIGLLSLAFAGADAWAYYMTVRLPDLLAGSALFNNLSLSGLVLRVFMGPELARGILDLQPDIAVARLLIVIAVLAVLVATAKALGRQARQGRAFVLEFSLAIVAALVISGVTWPHYLAWLLPLVGLSLAFRWPTGASRWTPVLCGVGLALASLPLDAYGGLFGSIFDISMTALSIRSLGLFTLFLGLLLAVRGVRSDADPSA
ncbi:MAG: glycosyltransferase family 87 protein [Chloroflexi bacterium]|nr:glycosyltransferase family 87 protein [Chloroflexota bacterium]MCY3958103.1 glycosyltransferase family 87 protein [Chloroflexota bacterium]